MGRKLQVDEEEVRCTDAEKHTYRYAFTLPEEPRSFGNMKLVLTVRSLLKLGEKDKNEEEWDFELASFRPGVERVGLGRPDGRVFYDSEREFFRPVAVGTGGGSHRLRSGDGSREPRHHRVQDARPASGASRAPGTPRSSGAVASRCPREPASST